MSEKNKELFTPGPWRNTMAEINPFKFFVCGKAGLIAIVGADGDIHTRHNAALIAAAPEMYGWQGDALALMRHIYCTVSMPCETVHKLYDLIARGEEIQKKARGEE